MSSGSLRLLRVSTYTDHRLVPRLRPRTMEETAYDPNDDCCCGSAGDHRHRIGSDDQATIDRALMAAAQPGEGRCGVVSWDASGSRVVLKESSNRMVCYDRSANPGTRPFAVQCTDEGNLDRVEQTLEAYAEGGDRASGQKLLDAMEANGTRIAPVFGSVWHTMNGDDAASAGTHITIAVPGATADSLGIRLAATRRSCGSWTPARRRLTSWCPAGSARAGSVKSSAGDRQGTPL